MRRNAQIRIIRLAAGAMPPAFARAMDQLREGIETGATVPDELQILWDTDDQEGTVNRVLMHRCYMDSDKQRDRGCPVQIVRYATAIPGFFDLYVSGEQYGIYGEDEFALNAGAYFGVVAHYIADLCNPVHVARNLDLSGTGYRKAGGFHSRIEADLDQVANAIEEISPYEPQPAPLTTAHFESLARQTYDSFSLQLATVYARAADPRTRAAFLEACIVRAARATADTWLAVFELLSPSALAALQ